MPGALPFYIDKVGVTFPAKGAAAAALAVIMGGIIKAKKTPGKFIGKFLLTNAIRPIKRRAGVLRSPWSMFPKNILLAS